MVANVIVIFLLMFPLFAFAGSLTINTTSEQDQAVLWKCGENCTATEAKRYVEVEFMSELNSWVREKQESDYIKQDVRQLWKDADTTARCNAIIALGGLC